ATVMTPIVFSMGEDPVKEGIVTNLNRPGGRITGVTSFGNQLVGKRLQLLHEILPGTAPLAFLVNSNNPNRESDTADAQAAAKALGRQLHVLHTGSERDVESAFDEAARLRASGLSVNVDPSFRAWRDLIVAQAARHSIPTVYERDDFASAGGLMAYGTDAA